MPGTPEEKVARGAVKFNPVTGKMQRIDETKTSTRSKSGEEMVREGCMMIPKKYLSGAVDAGLGNADGMYSHLSGIRRELNSGNNLGASRGRGVGSSSTRGGGEIVRTKNNIRQVVQGRSRTMRGNSGSSGGSDSAYARQKGVISTFGGCTSSKTRNYQEKKSERKAGGIAQLKSGSGGRTFVKTEDKSKAVGKALHSRFSVPSSKTASVPRRESVTKTLGGKPNGSKPGSSSSTAEDMRAKRAAYFASKFGNVQTA